jgi:CRP-like cAMP-binding protein
MDFIRKNLESIARLSDEDWKIFSSRLRHESVGRKSLLLKIGQVENHLSFLETGIIRYCIPREDKNDLTLAFGFGNSFVSAYQSFITRTPSVYQVETLTEVALWRLTHEDLRDIYAQTTIGERIGRLTAERIYLETSQREISLLNDTAEQRYLHLLSEQPRLIRNIPLKYLASYIGITPQALSRIRKRIK